ncbi:hypothetical protein RJT34_14384 [Clitoria ternatea]|uniref:Protein ENDOSPERM DEFECTIVE 1 n=1 Tax=Clitoria ternatea TaxID=43366 RepID=A0AAN9JQM2_CLITE
MQDLNPDSAAPPPPPPLPHHRRPRVREVSSRFMSPAVQRRPRAEADHAADENSDTPFPIGCSVPPRKQRAVKLFKESNGNEQVPPSQQHPQTSKSCSGRIGIGSVNSTPCASSRPDTPTPSIYVSSRYRLTQQQQQHHNHNHHRSINGSASAATKLLQASGLNQAKPFNSGSVSQNLARSNDDSSVNCSIQSLPELGDRDMLMQSSVSMVEKIGSGNCGDLKFHSTSLSRSISLPCENLLVKGGEKQPPSSVSKQHGNGNQLVKSGGGLSLPPVPPQCSKPALDLRRGKKGSSHQEDVHTLRMLYNRNLQWRFINAKAHSAINVQQRESQKQLYSLAMTISEKRDSVHRKRMELELLRRSKTLSTILEAQIPYLDEWSTMVEEYSVSINEAVQALLNASVQIPVGGNVRVDVKELGEALNSALKMLEAMISNIQRFMPKAEETDICISELARVAGGERSLIGECDVLLSKTYKSQVEECSLRGQLIQLHSVCHKDKNKEYQQATDN